MSTSVDEPRTSNTDLADIMSHGLSYNPQTIEMKISFTKSVQQRLSSTKWLEEMKTNTDKVLSMIDQNRHDPLLKGLLKYKDEGDDAKLEESNDSDHNTPWSCAVCTFINESKNKNCSICESPAPLPGMPKTFQSVDEENQWRQGLTLKSEIDAQDKIGEWYRGVVQQANDEQVLIHFLGWPIMFNEWIDRTSPRLNLRHSHYTEYGPKFRDIIPPERKKNTIFIPVPYLDTIRYSDVKLLKESSTNYQLEIPMFPPIEYPKHLVSTNPSNSNIIRIDKLISYDTKIPLSSSLFSPGSNSNDANIKPFRYLLIPNNPVSNAINEFASVYRPYSPGPGYSLSFSQIGAPITIQTGEGKFTGQIVDEDFERYKLSFASGGEVWIDKKQLQNMDQ